MRIEFESRAGLDGSKIAARYAGHMFGADHMMSCDDMTCVLILLMMTVLFPPISMACVVCSFEST